MGCAIATPAGCVAINAAITALSVYGTGGSFNMALREAAKGAIIQTATIGAQQLGASYGVPPDVTSGAISKAQGGDFQDGFEGYYKSQATNYVAGQAGLNDFANWVKGNGVQATAQSSDPAGTNSGLALDSSTDDGYVKSDPFARSSTTNQVLLAGKYKGKGHDSIDSVQLELFRLAKKFFGKRKTVVEDDLAIQKQVKLKPGQQNDYEKVKDLLSQGKTGRNQHQLKGDLSGKSAADLRGSGKGRGRDRVIYSETKDEVIIHDIVDYH